MSDDQDYTFLLLDESDFLKKSKQDLEKYLQKKIDSNNMKYLYHISKFGLDEDLNLLIDQEIDEFNEELEIVKKWLLIVPEKTLSELEDGNLEWWKELDVGEMYRIEFFHQLRYDDNTLNEIQMQGEFHDEIKMIKLWIEEWKENE
tara:strand:+ start:78 stop:515 length:438 start_codon:yes stop_codon:yes gene_type:complete